MKRSFNLLLIFFILFATSVFAQETVCNNYLDDDGDGFIDCFDPDCSSNAVCDDFYLGNDVDCQPAVPPSNKFTMTRDFSSPNETTNHLSRMAIGDLNRDGVPEIITMNRYTKRVFILNGSDGTIQSQATVTWEPQWEIAIANINNDACGEIFFFGTEGSDNYLYAYDCNLNFIWRTSNKLRGDPINYGIADFDSDGKIEIYVKDEIFDAHTGTRIVKSVAPSWKQQNGGPVAVDMDNDNRLELVLGLSIYKVNLGARTADVGSLTLFKSPPNVAATNYFIRNEFNATSVADYNLDGNLDIIASGSTIANGTNTTIFFWDVTANSVKTYIDKIAASVKLFDCNTNPTGTFYSEGWKNGTGRINIADLDGNGKMNASYVSGKYLYALDENFNLLWRADVNEETSGYTGCTLFDFNGDGQSEIVYRDEKFLYIINGNDGSVNTQQTCVSRTNREYPIVADVDADGSTEICVTCGFDDVLATTNFCNINYSQYSHVRVFKSNSEPWVPARRLWNQHGYFNVNVNNDLTIPRVQQKHHIPFSGTPCAGSVALPRPLNSFLNQSPFLDSKGCQVFTAPDLGFVAGSVDINPPTCPDKDFTVSFSVINQGDAPMSGDVPITFYNGDPRLPGAIKLNTTAITLVALSLNETFAVGNLTVNGNGSEFPLFIALNDDGTSVPTPIKLNPNFIECNYENNVDGGLVTPLPVAITALKIQDNIVCNPGATPNGAVRAFILTGGIENTIDYNFYWSNGLTAKPIPADFVGPTRSGLAAGDFNVYAVHKTANCGSDTAIVSPAIGDVIRTLAVTIEVVRGDDNCLNPNGQLQAFVNKGAPGFPNGEPAGNFTYEWYIGPTVGGGQVVGNSSIASNLVGGITPYTVLVEEKATGCSNSFSLAVPDNTVKPVVLASGVDILCSNANSGSASATVNGVTAGFTFNWFKGSFVKPTTDFPGSTATGVINSLIAGNYTVVAINNNSKCESDPVTISVAQTPAFTVTISNKSDQTSCDVSLPNGSATATVSVGAVSDYTFKWFAGQNTLPANEISGEISNVILGRGVGIYTVRAQNILTGCSDTEEVIIGFAVTPVQITQVDPIASSSCTSPNGSVTVTVVSPDTPAEYTFFWFKGSDVNGTPIADSDNVIDNLEPGDYTVIAIHNTRHCEAPPVTRTVVSSASTINFNQTAITRPTTCNESNGSLTIGVNAAGNILGFDFEWRRGKAPFQAPAITTNVVNTASVSTISGLFTGVYTLIATNRDNGCAASQFFNLPFDNAQVLFFDSKTPIETCVPGTGGSITVNLVKTIGFNETDYEIQVYEGTNDLDPAAPFLTIPCVNGITLYTLSSPTLQPGFYTFVARTINPIRSTFNCRSVPVSEEILIVTQNPVFTANTPINNMNCAGMTASGEITLNIATPANFTFDWFEGKTTSSPVLGAATSGVKAGVNGEVIQNLPAGFYTARVTDNTFPSTGCLSTQTFQVFDNPPIITLTAGDLSIGDKLRCDVPTGSATINSVSETVNGVTSAVLIASYTFEWFDVNLVSLLNGPNTIASLTPGTYFVQAKSSINNCASTMLSFEIKDMTVGDPTVNLVSFTDPTRCLKPANILGELHVDAVGNSTSTPAFKYRWFTGSDTTSFAFQGADLVGIDPAITPGLTFTIKAINNTTKCFVLDTYTLRIETAPILLTASANSLTYCNSPYDGTVFATITSGSQIQYNYNWYDETVKVTPDFTTSALTVPLAFTFAPLDSGNYIVIAIDQSDPTCFASDTVTVTNERVFPKINAQALRGLSICDLLVAKADGVAEASIEGDSIFHYNFVWLRDDFRPLGRPFAFANQVGGLADSTYFVVASHIVTGCSDSTSIAIPFTPLPIPFPQIEILSMKTSCVEDNGALSASVGGNTQDYIFDWYTGSGADTTYLTTGEMIDSLAIGFYTVTATSRITGCVSIAVSEEIKEKNLFPDFTFRVEPASCDKPDGYLSVIITTTDLEIGSIVWIDPAGNTINGPNVMNAIAGNYSVTVTTLLGCFKTIPVELLNDIKPFNGVSVNGDDKNPIFQIDCIQNFPNNVVKIFNRAGTLVYEANGYDNQITFFDGKSNKGISLMGTQLPGGTYFYVIDKRDGSKALAGYLEVVN